METKFSLTQRIEIWKKGFHQSALTHHDVEELAQHIESHFDNLPPELNNDEKWLIATYRTGAVDQLDQEFAKVNVDLNNGKNLLMLLWGAATLLIGLNFFVIMPMWWLKTANSGSLVNGNLVTSIMCFLLLSLLIATLFVSLKKNYLLKNLTKFLDTKPRIMIISLIMLSIPAYLGNLFLFANAFKGTNSLWLVFLNGLLYVSVLQFTIMATLRYKNSEYRTRDAFFREINWRSTILLGVLPGLLWLPFGFALGNLLFPFVFGLLGWLLSFSKKPAANLFSMQFVYMLMVLWTIISMTRDLNSSFWFHQQKSAVMSYLITISAMLICFSVGRVFNRERDAVAA